MKRVVALLLLAAAVLVQPLSAHAASSTQAILLSSEKDEGGTGIVQVYQAPSEEAGLAWEESLTQDGVTYQLISVDKRDLPAEIEQKNVNETKAIPCPSEDRQAALALFDTVIDYDKDGFIGTLEYVEDSLEIKTETADGAEKPISANRVYKGLARNDPSLVPKAIGQDDTYIPLVNIEWERSGDVFTAYAQYAGQTAEVSYLATIQYTGTVKRASQRMAEYVLTYGQHENPDSAAASSEPKKELEKAEDAPIEQAEKSGGYLYIGVIAVVLLLGTGAGLIIWFLKKPRQKKKIKIFLPRELKNDREDEK